MEKYSTESTFEKWGKVHMGFVLEVGFVRPHCAPTVLVCPILDPANPINALGWRWRVKNDFTLKANKIFYKKILFNVLNVKTLPWSL